MHSSSFQETNCILALYCSIKLVCDLVLLLCTPIQSFEKHLNLRFKWDCLQAYDPVWDDPAICGMDNHSTRCSIKSKQLTVNFPYIMFVWGLQLQQNDGFFHFQKCQVALGWQDWFCFNIFMPSYWWFAIPFSYNFSYCIPSETGGLLPLKH